MKKITILIAFLISLISVSNIKSQDFSDISQLNLRELTDPPN